MGEVLAFGVFALVAVGLVHHYLWRRLIRDTTTSVRWRRVGRWTMVGLAALLVFTLVGGQVLPHSLAALLSWPGHMWLAVMFYLVIALALMELPALAARVVLRRSAQRGELVTANAGRAGGTTTATADLRSGEPTTAVQATAAATGTDPTAGDVAAGDSASGDSPPGDSTGGDSTGRGSTGGDSIGGDGGKGNGHSRRLFLARTVAITAGVVSVSVVASGVRSALGPPRIKRIRIPLAKLPASADGYRIALVSDIHLGPLRGYSHTRRIVDLINGLDADIVTVVGDLVDGSVAQLGAAARPLNELRSRHGSYFVTGNHEYYSGYQEWIDEVTELGLRPLRNEWLELPGGFDLSGVNDVSGKSYEDGPDFDRALAGRDPSRAVVMLAHQPIQAHDAVKHGVDLQLSGHTHGGQLFPFNYVVRAAQQPVVSGLGDVDGMPVYVTNGAGFWGPPVRVGAPPDITLVELASQ